MSQPETFSPRDLPAGYERRALRSLLPFLWPPRTEDDWLEMRLRILAAGLLLVGAKVATVYVPLLFKDAIDALAPGGGGMAAAIPLGLLLAYGGARLLSGTFQELRDAVFAKVSHRAIRRVSLSTFQHLHGLSLRFHLDRQTGGITRAIERGSKGIEWLLSFMLFSIVPTLVEIAMVCAILWALFDVWYMLVTFCTVAGYATYTIVVTEWRLKHRRRMNQADETATSRAVDSLLNYETVKYFGNEGFESERYDEAVRRYERASVVSQTSLSLLNIGQAAIIAVGVTLIMAMAARDAVRGDATIGDFVLVNTYLLQLYQPLNFLGFVYREIKQALVDMERMFSLLREEQEVQDRPGAPDLAVVEGSVRFDDVCFRYDIRRQILCGISFEVPAGRTLAIVGATGSGKSTISRILFRFYDIESGRVTIDRQDIRDVTQGSLRAAIGVVPQDTVLFNDTLRYNIAYGRPGASDAEVEEAARLAQLHEFVQRLPDGYETTVGERGLKLSGGEKQRVAIARTILKNPRILLFDEATSALDTHTERDIQKSLKEVSKERTTLIIAHRLSTVVDADSVLVLEAGRVIEQGRHEDLLARGGAYARMWQSQQSSVAATPSPPGLSILPGETGSERLGGERG